MRVIVRGVIRSCAVKRLVFNRCTAIGKVLNIKVSVVTFAFWESNPNRKQTTFLQKNVERFQSGMSL